MPKSWSWSITGRACLTSFLVFHSRRRQLGLLTTALARWVFPRLTFVGCHRRKTCCCWWGWVSVLATQTLDCVLSADGAAGKLTGAMRWERLLHWLRCLVLVVAASVGRWWCACSLLGCVFVCCVLVSIPGTCCVSTLGACCVLGSCFCCR